jgi:ABC-type transporter Mla MlaB component
LELTAIDSLLVRVDAPAVAVTAKVYEYCAVSVKVKVMLGAVPDTLNPVVITVPPLFTAYV